MQWTPEQQAEHRKLWVEALRSGNYSQARSALRTDSRSFCCLGVACEISGLGEWQMAEDEYFYLGNNKGLPEAVKEWLGLAGSLGGHRPAPEELKYLSDYNDGGTPFPVIADLIESEPEGLIAKAGA